MLSSSVLFFALAPILALCAIALIAFFMRTRRFYFIRHGETLLNAEHIRQGSDGALSENGRRQSDKVGRYLKRFPINRILSSTYPRARETAEIIAKHLTVPIRYSPLLIERRNPSEIIGKHRDDTEVVRIVDHIDHSYHADDYRFSDEENFVDLKQRARTCLSFLAWHGTRETVVVTHHVFLKILIAYLLYRERLHADGFAKLSFFNYSDNASITVCEFHPWKILNATHGWEVVSYNEQPT